MCNILLSVGRPEAEKIIRRVGSRVRARRRALGITARSLAERSGLSPRFVSQLEGGEANIAIGRLASVAQALEVSVASLVVFPFCLLRMNWLDSFIAPGRMGPQGQGH